MVTNIYSSQLIVIDSPYDWNLEAFNRARAEHLLDLARPWLCL